MKKKVIALGIILVPLFLLSCVRGTQSNTPGGIVLSSDTPKVVALPSPASPCTLNRFEDWQELDTSQVKQMTDEALIEEVTAIASKLDDSSLGEYYDREIYFLEHPTNPETLFVEYDRLYRIHTCEDTTLLRRVDGVWELLPTPKPGMSSYDAADLIAFVQECNEWSLYIAAGEGYYLSAHKDPYRSRDGGLSWLSTGDLHLLDEIP